ncbi:MAG: PBP1A family penicillin-binding protein [Pseudomonadota bacterium]
MAKKTQKKSKKKKQTKKNKKSFGGFLKFCFKWGFVLSVWAGIFISILLIYYASELSSITKDMVFERRPTIIVKAADGKIVDRYGDIKGEIVDVRELPSHVTNAVLAIEDRRFYSHYGIDPLGIARAFVVNIQRGGFVQGGSTITQQLAKNLFLTRERTIKRKIQEIMLALQLERELTKDEILSAYLNRVYLGSGAYGIDAAAQTYFRKSAEDLTVSEAATIAGLLKAPSRFSPNANPVLAKERSLTVLKAMNEAGYLEDTEFEKTKNASPVPRRKPSSSESVHYYTDYIVSQINDLIGPTSEDIIVETTLNMTIQMELEESITKKLLQIKEERNVDQAAGLVMRLDGAVVALMGGEDYSVSEFNRVTDSLRPPGSAFKPFVYLTALEEGLDMMTLIMDEPRRYGSYRPRNFGNEYYGLVTLYEALTLSLNTVAVELMKQVTPPTAIQTARRLGITADLESSLSTALGSNGIPMMQMVTAYAILGRGGSAVDPYAITKITNKDGKVLYERTRPTQNLVIVEREHASQLNAMMRSVIQNGTGQAASIPYPAAGKTGTSQEFRDAWFVGYTNKYAGAIWFGNDDNSPTKRLTGGSAPAQVWREVMSKAQTQGGRSYANFFYYDIDNRFDQLLADILSNDEYLAILREGGDSEGWIGGLFGGRNQTIFSPYESNNTEGVSTTRRRDGRNFNVFQPDTNEPQNLFDRRQDQFRRQQEQRPKEEFRVND